MSVESTYQNTVTKQEPAQPVRARELVSERAGSVARAMQALARQTPDPLRRPVTLLFADTIGVV